MVAFLWFRINMLNGVLPYFLEQDNPAAYSDSLLTRYSVQSNLFYSLTLIIKSLESLDEEERER